MDRILRITLLFLKTVMDLDLKPNDSLLTLYHTVHGNIFKDFTSMDAFKGIKMVFDSFYTINDCIPFHNLEGYSSYLVLASKYCGKTEFPTELFLGCVEHVSRNGI